MKEVICQFGSSHFRVISDDWYADRLSTELGGEHVDDTAMTLYICRPSRDRELVHNAFQSRVYGLERHRFENGEASFVLVVDKDELLVLIKAKLTPKMKVGRYLPSFLVRLGNFKYLDSRELEFTRLLYSSVLWLAFLDALRNGDGLLHASSIDLNGQLVALSGRGGAGKTTMSGWLIARQGGHYLADDLLPLANCRTALPRNLHIHIYPYNVMIDRIWRKLGRAAMGLERIHWAVRFYLFGPKGTCRRLPMSVVYSEDRIVGTPQKLAKIIWLGQGAAVYSGDVRSEFIDDHFNVLEDEMRYAFRAMTDGDLERKLFPDGFLSAVRNMLLAVTSDVAVQYFIVDKEANVEINGQRLLAAIG